MGEVAVDDAAAGGALVPDVPGMPGEVGLPSIAPAGAEEGEKRYTILPLLRSYGVISNFTRSPGRMRTRWTRMRPARWQRS